MLKAQSSDRSRPDGFEPYTARQQQLNPGIAIQHNLLHGTGIRFIVTGHFPQMHGEFSGHSGDGLVFVAGIMNEPAERIVSIGVFSYPQPGALDE